MQSGEKEFSLAFLTVGQAPRTDIFPELTDLLKYPVRYREFGAVDDNAALATARTSKVKPDQLAYCSRLRDGSEVVLDKIRVTELMQQLLLSFKSDEFDLVVILCSGDAADYKCACPVITAGEVISQAEDDLRACGLDLGIITPLAEGMQKYIDGQGYSEAAITFASPYSGADMAKAGAKLGAYDLILMHCLGYSREMGNIAETQSGKPVLTARQLLSKGINDWLSFQTQKMKAAV